jgi:hypothetical protein
MITPWCNNPGLFVTYDMLYILRCRCTTVMLSSLSPQPRKSTRSTPVRSQKTSCCSFPSKWQGFEFLSWGKWWEFSFHECFLDFKCLTINLSVTLYNCTTETALVGQCNVSVAWEGLPYEKLCDCVWDSLAIVHTHFSIILLVVDSAVCTTQRNV